MTHYSSYTQDFFGRKMVLLSKEDINSDRILTKNVTTLLVQNILVMIFKRLRSTLLSKYRINLGRIKITKFKFHNTQFTNFSFTKIRKSNDN